MIAPRMEKKMSWAAISMVTARAILQIRELRRKVMFYLVVVVLGLVALGSWPLAGWLEDSLGRMIFYWGAVMALTLFMMLLALYDMLAVVKEFKDRKSEL
jgi:apolipoprotein N-acyltransferase